MNALRHMADQPDKSGRNALADLASLLQKVGAANSKEGMDTILAHITPEEAMLLRLMGGSGRVDPQTGALHFDDSGDGDGPGGDGGPGDTEGGGPGANPGGENAAHGVNESTTEGRDAAYGGGWGDIGGGIGDFFANTRAFMDRNYPTNIATPGLIGTMVSAVAPGVGLAMQAGPAVAEFAGNGITSLGEAISGETASAPPGSVDYSQSNNGLGGGGGLHPSGPSIGSIPLGLGGPQNALAQMGRRNAGTPFFVGSIQRG